MAQLNSPGISVTVIDESFYTPAAPGTTPLIIVASAENKTNAAGTGTAPGSLKANAGKVYLMTSQKDLADTFGTPFFETDANNNPVHAGERNEYGLQAAYSYLGVSNRAYIVRADVDTSQLVGKANAPAGEAENGTFWFDTASSNFGVFEWNGSGLNVTGGQTFTHKTPTVITDITKVDGNNAPLPSVGKAGDYAIVATTSLVKLWYKKPQTNTNPGWVEVGSAAWVASWPVVQSGTGTIQNGSALTIANSTAPNFTQTAIQSLVDAINADSGLDDKKIKAANIDGRLTIYSQGEPVVIGGTSAQDLAITTSQVPSKTFQAPALQISEHYDVPLFKAGDPTPRPTGAVWVKTTEPNLGAKLRVKKYNSTTKAWNVVSAPIYDNGHNALYNLDKVGGGINLSKDAVYVKSNDAENTTTIADYKLYRRTKSGATIIKSAAITDTTFNNVQYGFTISYTKKGMDTLTTSTISFQGVNGSAGGVTSAQNLLFALQAQLQNSPITAERVVATNQITITHTEGGDMRFVDTIPNAATGPIGKIFTLTDNFFLAPTNPGGNSNNGKYLASLWSSFVYDDQGNKVSFATNSGTAPTTLTADGQLWYDSVLEEVDILINNGTTWVGYKASGTPVDAQGGDATDPAGPIISASKPKVQSDGTPLANGDLWIDTSDTENFPRIYKYSYVLKKWALVDNSDQTTESGIVFADARWNTTGKTADASSIADLLVSNYLDPDCPDPALYPKGMLLWNLRRSGYNVKRFVRNYIDQTKDNLRYKTGQPALPESMETYYPHRWVSEAANQENGAGTFGRKAQRAVIVQKLQALVNSNQQIRDEESRIFNLLACPGYPELIDELISLNYDRGLTAFIVGDTPARLTPDATTISNWGQNVGGALQNNDQGLVSFDEYLGVFYPWGYTSDNLGNNVVVPPSHMMLRTIALSDQVSYPWFAPAGTRRGGITNATAVGYVTKEGEFQSVALNTGQRDTLQQQAKVNPLTFITGTGLVNYGQLTRAKNASALDRINVARLVIYLRRQLSQLAKPYVFEPNDKITRDEIKGAAESLLLELVGQRALYDYVVVCDNSNNTPARIDRNELYLDIAIEPVKAVEFIYIPLRLKNTGEIKALGK